MARPRRVTVFQFNIAANPHTQGVYPRLFDRMSHIVVGLRGSDYGKITGPHVSETQASVYRGQVLIWTDIDLQGRWIDTEKEEELSDELRKAISIPPNARPNFRSFDFVLDEAAHQLYVESRNDLNETISAGTLLRLLQGASGPERLGEGWPQVEVTVVPEAGAVDEIINLPRLNTLYIRLVRPNPDSADDGATTRVLAKLDELHAHRLEMTIKKASEADRLTIVGEYKEVAEVAAENGMVEGKGKTADGSPVELSTRSRPKRIELELERGQNLLARLLSKIPGLGQNQNPQ